MKYRKSIDENRYEIAEALYEWAYTFEHEYDEEGELTLEPFNYVFALAKKLENNQCSTSDYQEILFHIEQINYNEVKIVL